MSTRSQRKESLRADWRVTCALSGFVLYHNVYFISSLSVIFWINLSYFHYRMNIKTKNKTSNALAKYIVSRKVLLCTLIANTLFMFELKKTIEVIYHGIGCYLLAST